MKERSEKPLFFVDFSENFVYILKMKKFLINSWRIWANAIGTKTGKNDLEADLVASVRTILVFIAFVTNFFIMAGVIRHW